MLSILDLLANNEHNVNTMSECSQGKVGRESI